MNKDVIIIIIIIIINLHRRVKVLPDLTRVLATVIMMNMIFEEVRFYELK